MPLLNSRLDIRTIDPLTLVPYPVDLSELSVCFNPNNSFHFHQMQSNLAWKTKMHHNLHWFRSIPRFAFGSRLPATDNPRVVEVTVTISLTKYLLWVLMHMKSLLTQFFQIPLILCTKIFQSATHLNTIRFSFHTP